MPNTTEHKGTRSFPEIQRDKSFYQKVALLQATGSTRKQISVEMKIPYGSVAFVLRRPETVEALKQLQDTYIYAAKAQIKVAVSEMVTKILSVINRKLDEGELEAVKIGLKILGFQEQEPLAPASTSLTVVLPGANQKPTIEVPNDNNEGTEST